MLDILHRIVQEVNTARDLGQALNIIVDRLVEALEADVASVYLVGEDQESLSLMATRGLRTDAVGHVRMRWDEGLVGLVAEREEPINLQNADQHPRFRFFPGTGEEDFHSFLGVPVIHYRQLLGVVVVQGLQSARFDDDKVAFLVTMAAQLSGVIAHARATGGLRELVKRRGYGRNRPLSGVAGATGVGIGRAFTLNAATDFDDVPDTRADDPEAEVIAFREAVSAVREDLREMHARLEGMVSEDDRRLFEVYMGLLDGNSLTAAVEARIREGVWAGGAVRDVILEQVRRFDEMEDGYLRERASDVRDIGRRLIARLGAMSEGNRPMPRRVVLIGHEVSASELAEIPRERLVGVVSATGSANSHVAILARALGVAAVMGVSDLRPSVVDGRELIVDGYRGRLYVQPTRTVMREYRRLQREERQLGEELKALQALPAESPDGVRIRLYVNTGLISDVASSREVGCDGVGLHRTEFPFMVRERFPGEQEQARLYREVLEAFAPLPVTLRTLDVGGDKMLPYFRIEDDNPFLGWRGVRVTLDHPEIFLTQIRAMLRASEGLNNLQIMFPMVSRVEEVEQSLALVHRARRELEEEGVAVPPPRLGAMVEVPAAVYQAASLARRLDFLSIGSNDLAQYLLAVDRNNPRVASLYDELHPAVLRAVQEVAKVGLDCGVPVSVCGGMAGNPATALLLFGMGISGLSMSSVGLLRVKWVMRSFPHEEARALVGEALRREYPDEVRTLVRGALEAKGLGTLTRAGR